MKPERARLALRCVLCVCTAVLVLVAGPAGSAGTVVISADR